MAGQASKTKGDSSNAAGNPSDTPASMSAPSPNSSILNHLFASPITLYTTSFLFRLILLLYGLWQDANSPVKYTDIDYLVFTDAARFVSRGQSPYERETYRYTPLLAWLLVPTSFVSLSSQWTTTAWFSFGKVLFALGDLGAGWLVEVVLTMPVPGRGPLMDAARARKFAAIWLLNPMVANISTRGSSESLLGVLVMALLWAVLARRVTLAGLLLGFGVHFKIYPFIYAPAIVWWMDDENLSLGPSSTSEKKGEAQKGKSVLNSLIAFITPERMRLAAISLATFSVLNILMFAIYGTPFLQHTYLHHVTRLDHRHNFSIWNTLLYLTSAAPPSSPPSSSSSLRIESLAFLPQLLLSCVLIPLALAKHDLPSTMLAQTFAFVTFNKVCTSQYFLWYLVLLPLYLPRSSLLRRPRLGVTALALWVVAQAAWLQQGFALEFLGRSTFVPGLWAASVGFFLVNCWILGVIVGDVAGDR